ncbi:MAG: hypothetical protein NTZ59_08360 [Bacteroidetes bacterium]|nr:hypothetical protein [Bacteroidota bacterium]
MEQQPDFFNEMEDNKLPSMLNVLTILTFIGCAFTLWDVIKTLNAEAELAKVQEAMSKVGDVPMPEFFKNMTEKALEMAKIKVANKIPIVIVDVLGLVLCIYGAIQMRARKMGGFYMYFIGEVLPIISAAIFFGAIIFKGFFALFLVFPLLFIILYTTQRKHLTK